MSSTQGDPAAYYLRRRDEAKRKIAKLVQEVEGWNRLYERTREDPEPLRDRAE